MPFVLLHFHKEKDPAGTPHRFSYGLLPQSGGAVSPPVSGENGRSPIFSADGSNRTVRDNTAADPHETAVPRFSAGHISYGEGPDCHRSGQMVMTKVHFLVCKDFIRMIPVIVFRQEDITPPTERRQGARKQDQRVLPLLQFPTTPRQLIHFPE